MFAKPLEEDQDFSDFLQYVIQQEKGFLDADSEVRYAQTRKLSLTEHRLLES